MTLLLQTIQLYEMIVVRHGLMTVGQPFCGKSCSLKVLAGALSDLHEQGVQGTLFSKVQVSLGVGGGGWALGGGGAGGEEL